MLVLTRKVGSSIIIDDHIKIQIVKVKGRQVRLCIEAPKEVKVHREEVQRSLNKSNNLETQIQSTDRLSL